MYTVDAVHLPYCNGEMHGHGEGPELDDKVNLKMQHYIRFLLPSASCPTLATSHSYAAAQLYMWKPTTFSTQPSAVVCLS